MARQIDIAGACSILCGATGSDADEAAFETFVFAEQRDAAGLQRIPRHGVPDPWLVFGMFPCRVVVAGPGPSNGFFTQINLFLIGHLRGQWDHILADLGLAAGFPSLVGDHEGFARLQGEQEPGRVFADVGKGAAPRMMRAHGDDVFAFLEPGPDIDLVKRPVRLETARRPTADVAAVEVESIRLVGGDQDARLAWNRIKREALAEKGVAVVQIGVGKALPDPTCLLQRVGNRGCLRHAVIGCWGFG